MKKCKKILSLILCVCLLFTFTGLTGCKENSEQTAKTGKQSDSKDKVKLTIWWAEGEEFKEILQDAISNFKGSHPNVEIVPQWQPTFDTFDKLKVAIAGNSAPDMTKMDSIYVPALGYKEKLADLSNYGADEIKDKFIQSTWKAGMYKGKVYALPFDANTIGFFYNKAILDKAGMQPPKTYEDIIKVGKAISDLNLPDIYPYTLPVITEKSGWLTFQWFFWLWRNGGEILNDDWTEATYNSPEGIDALQKMVDLIHKHEIVPNNVYLEGEFYDGSVGMLDMGCWSVKDIVERNKSNNEEGKIPGEFDVATMPKLKDDVPGHSGLGLYSLVVLSSCKNQQQAYDFIKSLAISKDYQVKYAKDTNLMPSLNEAYDDEYFQTSQWKVFLEQLKIAKARPGTPIWPEIEENITVAIQEALSGKKTPKEALDAAAEKSNEALKSVK